MKAHVLKSVSAESIQKASSNHHLSFSQTQQLFFQMQKFILATFLFTAVAANAVVEEADPDIHPAVIATSCQDMAAVVPLQ